MRNIPIMVDTERITTKPTSEDTEGIDGIWGRCLVKDNYREISQEELLEILGSGKSFIPCKTKGFTNKKESLLETHLVILDVDNTELDENKKAIPLSKDDSRYLSIENALEMPIIRDGAFAVQKSIRYSEESERFKIVFLLKKPVTDCKEDEKLYKYLKQQIPFCDKKVDSSTRIFYGGKSDEGAVIKIGNIFDNSALIFEDMDETTGDNKVILPDTMKDSTADFVEMVKRGDSDELKEWFYGTLFDPSDMTIDGIYCRLLQTDMTILLKTGGNKFCCLFHDDTHPSGAIYKSDNGNWYYKCHSESCDTKGDFLSLIQGILECKGRVEAFNWFLKKLDLYPKEYQSLIEQMTVGFDTLTSHKDDLHRAIRGRLSEMEETYRILLYGVYFSADNDGNIISIMSGRLLAQQMEQKYGRKNNLVYATDKWNKILSFMTFIGMVEKLDNDSLPDSAKKYLEQVADQVKGKTENISHTAKKFEPKRANVYRLCKLDASFFTRLWDEIIPTMNEFYFTYQHFSYDWVRLCFGKEKAKSVFPQNAQSELSDQKKEILLVTSKYLERLFDQKKIYVITERKLIEIVSGLLPNYKFKSIENTLKENRGYFINLGYYLFRATKDIKVRLNLVSTKSCFVYSAITPKNNLEYRALVIQGVVTPMQQIGFFIGLDGKRITETREPINLE
ncbi:hypothetical protein ABQD92_03075 [Enterococcus avium]|uniref:hypothetical protein n=1 Tax=Enterococcus avium TaxID=33945 RepID=UPI0032E3CA06